MCKISSQGYIDGLYAGFPRVDKNLIKEYKQDLIATTSGIYGEIAQLIIEGNTVSAKESFLWWLNEFKDDFFIEINRNDVQFEDEVNKILLSGQRSMMLSVYQQIAFIILIKMTQKLMTHCYV